MLDGVSYRLTVANAAEPFLVNTPASVDGTNLQIHAHTISVGRTLSIDQHDVAARLRFYEMRVQPTVAITQPGPAQPSVTQTVGRTPPPPASPKTVIDANGTYWQVVDNDGTSCCRRRRIETPWFCRRLGLLDFDQGLVGPLCIVERGFELGRWDVVEVAVEAAGVVPVHPAQGGQFDVLDGLPGPGAGRSVDQLGLVVSVHRLREGISKLSPMDPIEGTAPISARRSP